MLINNHNHIHKYKCTHTWTHRTNFFLDLTGKVDGSFDDVNGRADGIHDDGEALAQRVLDAHVGHDCLVAIVQVDGLD